VLNASLIRSRRLEFGLSRPTLARSLNVSTTTISGLEAGTNHRDQTLDLVDRHARALSVPCSALLEEAAESLEPTQDDVRLEAALVAIARPLSAKDLALSLGWTLPRVTETLDDLRRRLTTTGQRLRLQAGKHGLTYAREEISNEDLQSLERRRVSTSKLSKAEARTLVSLIAGEITPRWLSNSTPHRHTTAHRLLRLGYAEEREGTLHISEAVALGLGLRRRS